MNIMDILTNEKKELEAFNAIDYECLSNNVLYSLEIGNLEWRYWVELVHLYLTHNRGERYKISEEEINKAMKHVKTIIYQINDEYKKLETIDHEDKENAWGEIEEILKNVK